MRATFRCLSLEENGHLGDASRVRKHEALKHRRSVEAPSHKRCRNSVSQSAGAAVICVWHRLFGTVSSSSYQQHACVNKASGERDSRSSRSQGDRREARPHLCPDAQASVTTMSHSPPPSHQPPSSTSAGSSQRRGLPLLSSPRFDLSPYPSCPWL